jgi:hypothetical protein
MTNDPDEGQNNPFKGTPFEQFFGMLGGAPGGGGAPDLGALFGQIQAMMQPYDGPLNWNLALDLPRPPSGSRTRSPTRSASPTTGSTRSPTSRRA